MKVIKNLCVQCDMDAPEVSIDEKLRRHKQIGVEITDTVTGISYILLDRSVNLAGLPHASCDEWSVFVKKYDPVRVPVRGYHKNTQ